MPIPKKIFQSWCTRDLPAPVQQNIDRFMALNPGYTHHLFTDEDMETYVKENFAGPIYDCYMRLNIIVAKVDFWRYLVLYKEGGVYVDMDGDILRPLDDMIRPDDAAIVTVETNPNMFVQWALFFEAGHPILKRAIEIVVHNIQNNLFPHDVHQLTGPSVFSLAVYQTHDENITVTYGETLEHRWIGKTTDKTYESADGKFKYRIFGVDYNGFCTYTNPYKEYLFENKTHWRQEQYQKKTVSGGAVPSYARIYPW